MNTNSTASFETLVEAHYQPLFNFAVKLCGAPDKALDLTQQAFYQALRRFEQLRERGKFKSWLFSILFREFLQQRRQATRFRHESLEESEKDLPAVDANSGFRLDGATLREELAKLPEHFRAPLVLFYLEDRAYREIADELEVPIGTVMSRISRGKQLLREALRPELQRSQP